MPVRLTVEKEFNGEFWTNVYWINEATVAGAMPAAAEIVGAERAIHWNQVLFTRYRVDDAVKNTDNYVTGIINGMGQVAFDSQSMPLFVVLRVDFTVAGSRPSRKYLRGCLQESNVDGPINLVAASVNAWQNLYADRVANVATFGDVDGQDITAGRVHPRVAMRQLRRGSKKKVTPSTTTTTP